jgi:hypothetical protein
MRKSEGADGKHSIMKDTATARLTGEIAPLPSGPNFFETGG